MFTGLQSSLINLYSRSIPAISFNPYALDYNKFTTIAGNDIQCGSQVYLLYEIPASFLARNFKDAKYDKNKIAVHELNGCIVGPGFYQEWATHVHAARFVGEQNLELCRNTSNNMLLFKAIKNIKKGDELLAWYSENVEEELCFHVSSTNNYKYLSHLIASIKNETKCKVCLMEFEHKNMLKSHYLFDICGKTLINSTTQIVASATTTSTMSTTSGSLFQNNSCVKIEDDKMMMRNNKPIISNKSAFMPLMKSTKIFKQEKSTSLSSSSSSSISSPPSITDSICNSSHKIDESFLYLKKNSKTIATTNVITTNATGTKSDNDGGKSAMNYDKTAEILASKDIDWKFAVLDGTQTVELQMADELGKSKKSHVCLYCGKIYNRKYGLKIHLRTHTGYKPLKCKICNRPFSDPSNLNKHVRLHSQGETPYRCEYCDKILVRKRDLDRHILSRHSGSGDNCNNDLNRSRENSGDNYDEHPEAERSDLTD